MGEQKSIFLVQELMNKHTHFLVVMEFLEKLHKQGKTIIMVTHDPDLAKKYADIVYWLLDGKLNKVTKRVGKNFIDVTKAKKKGLKKEKK